MNKVLVALFIAALVVGGLILLNKEPLPGPPPIQPIPENTLPPTQPKPEIKKEATYEGSWVTTGARKRHLNGIMTSVVTNTGDNQWSGKFFGAWEGVRFSYVVSFTGPPDRLVGKANIDNNSYDWTGQIVGNNFTGTFQSPRYDGSFNLKEK